MNAHLMHCLACDDVRYVTRDRAFCACGRSSARRVEDGVVLVGPGQVFEAGRAEANVQILRPSVAVSM